MDRVDLINELKNSFAPEETVKQEDSYVERYNFDKKNYCRLVVNHDKQDISIPEFDTAVKALLNSSIPECVAHAKNLYLYKDKLHEKFSEEELQQIKKEAGEITKVVSFGNNNQIFVCLQVDGFANKILGRFN